MRKTSQREWQIEHYEIQCALNECQQAIDRLQSVLLEWVWEWDSAKCKQSCGCWFDWIFVLFFVFFSTTQIKNNQQGRNHPNKFNATFFIFIFIFILFSFSEGMKQMSKKKMIDFNGEVKIRIHSGPVILSSNQSIKSKHGSNMFSNANRFFGFSNLQSACISNYCF